MNVLSKIWKKIGMWFVLILVCLTFFLINDNFSTRINIVNIIRQVSILGVCVTGYTYVFIGGSTDLSAGPICALVGVIGAKMFAAGYGLAEVIVVSLVVSMLASALNAVLSMTLKTPAFIITMATMNIYTGIALIVSEGKVLSNFGRDIAVLAQSYIGDVFPTIGLIFIVLCAFGLIILKYTYFGRYVYAIGGNREAARLAGVNDFKYSVLIHGFAGFFYGWAGLLLLARTMAATATTASGYSFSCITACCLGGITLGGGEGPVTGGLLGILVLGVLANGLTICGVSDYAQQVINGLLLILALTISLAQKHAASKATTLE